MIVSGYVFFGMIFLLFAFMLAFAFAVDVDVSCCSFFVARELMRTRGVGCGNASGPTHLVNYELGNTLLALLSY